MSGRKPQAWGLKEEWGEAEDVRRMRRGRLSSTACLLLLLMAPSRLQNDLYWSLPGPVGASLKCPWTNEQGPKWAVCSAGSRQAVVSCEEEKPGSDLVSIFCSQVVFCSCWPGNRIFLISAISSFLTQDWASWNTQHCSSQSKHLPIWNGSSIVAELSPPCINLENYLPQTKDGNSWKDLNTRSNHWSWIVMNKNADKGQCNRFKYIWKHCQESLSNSNEPLFILLYLKILFER